MFGAWGAAISSRTLAASDVANGNARPKRGQRPFDFARLKRAIAALIERTQSLRSENADLRGDLEQRDERIRSLELRILELGQRREDALKQLDELIARVEGLEAQFDDKRR